MFRWQCRQKPEPSKHSWELPLQSQGEHSPDNVRKNPALHLSTAGSRRPSVTRGLLVSDGSCLPTTELPSMSKGNALPSPDAALEQPAPQRSHRGNTEHQATFQAISPLIFNGPPHPPGRRVWESWWAPRGAAMPELLSSLGLQDFDPGIQFATLLLLLLLG